MFSVCFKTALFKYVAVLWSGFLSAKLKLFCSWQLCAANKQLQRTVSLHSNCLKYLGKTTFLHQVTEMSSEFRGEKKSRNEAYKDVFLWQML